MTRYVLFVAGELTATPRLLSQIAGLPAIAADAGIRHARATGLVPELWVGDFDSAGIAERERYAAVSQDVHPREKDMTDGDIAIRAALGRGARSLVVAGAFGGPRTDHALQIMAAAISLHEAGIDTVLTDGEQEGYPLRIGEENSFDLPEGTIFSVVAFSDLEGLTISGARWPLADEAVPFGSSRTLSNIATGPVRVSLAGGRALLIARFAERSPAFTDEDVSEMIEATRETGDPSDDR